MSACERMEVMLACTAAVSRDREERAAEIWLSTTRSWSSILSSWLPEALPDETSPAMRARSFSKDSFCRKSTSN